MINLLSPSQKEEIRAARLNVQLRKYLLLSSFVTVAVLAVYGVGFYLVINDKEQAQQQLNQDEAAVIRYQAVQKDAKAYKANLAIANKVLSSGASYSTFLTNAAQALPPGSVLTDLALNELGGAVAASVPVSGTITLHARTTSYGGALQIKESLEASDVFESVSITDVTKNTITDQSTALEKKYPFTVNVSVVVTKPKVVK